MLAALGVSMMGLQRVKFVPNWAKIVGFCTISAQKSTEM
jgi:hypothetical protein